MDLKGKSAAFFDGSDLKLVYVDETVNNKLQVRSESGRNFKIPLKTIVCAVSPCTFEQFTADCSEVISKIDNQSADIETSLLWEMADQGSECTAQIFAENYFGDDEPLNTCAMFLALVKDTVHFKRKGLDFIPRTEEQVNEQKTALRRKREKEEFKERIVPWLKEIIAADEVVEVPEEFRQFLNQLEVYLTNRKPNEASQTLAAASGEGSLKETVYEILVKCDVIDKSKDRFLLLAGIDEQFSNRVLMAAEDIENSFPREKRTDCTDLLTFSIDDEETLDIDDALSLERLDDGGFKVGIHIADVSAYITKDDILDKEASQRVTSIYLPTGTVHMFPEVLSQKQLSLTAGDIRPAMSFFIDFDSDLKIVDSSVKLTEIRVDHKLSYTGTDQTLKEDSTLATVMNDLLLISEALKKDRMEKGAALFNRPELKILAKDDDVSVKVMERNSPSRAMIAEFMVLANCTGALFCVRNDVPVIYRTQPKPENLPEMDPDVYDPILFEQSIRCMKKSRLSLHPQSHGGLGADFYIQLTSPIRRYTDLVIQRQISAYLTGEDLPYEPEELMSVIAAAESVNGDVREVQRQSENFWLHTYMKLYMTGNEFEATVISKAPGGCIIEIDEVFHKTKLMTSDKFNNGSRIKVRIDEVDVTKSHIIMTVCD